MDSTVLLERPLSGFNGPQVAPLSPRSQRARLLERLSALDSFFTGGLDFDDRLDGPTVWRFAEEARALLQLLAVPPVWGHGVVLKLCRLGQHRADGIYYPEPGVLAVDSRALNSFAHELGHLIDYRARSRPGARNSKPVLSGEPGFLRFYLELRRRMAAAPRLMARLRGARGRVSWRYYASPSECFARAFEQVAAARLVAPACVVKRPEVLCADELYYPALPVGMEAYFGMAVMAGVPITHFALESSPPNLQNAGFPQLDTPT